MFAAVTRLHCRTSSALDARVSLVDDGSATKKAALGAWVAIQERGIDCEPLWLAKILWVFLRTQRPALSSCASCTCVGAASSALRGGELLQCFCHVIQRCPPKPYARTLAGVSGDAVRHALADADAVGYLLERVAPRAVW